MVFQAVGSGRGLNHPGMGVTVTSDQDQGQSPEACQHLEIRKRRKTQ